MTIRMQESEAAENFSRFLAHLEAGDHVQVERDGKALTVAQVPECQEMQPVELGEFTSTHPRGSLEAVQAFFEWYAPLLADEHYTRTMKEAREVFNQPLEPRF